MKKMLSVGVVIAIILAFLFMPVWAAAYDYQGGPNPPLGGEDFRVFGANIFPSEIDLYGNYPEDGMIGIPPSNNGYPADLDIFHNGLLSGMIPLVNHDGFTAGNEYNPDTYLIRNGIPTLLQTSSGPLYLGTNPIWISLPGVPKYETKIYFTLSDLDEIQWGGGDCGNSGLVPPSTVPIPPSAYMLFSGLVGIWAWRKRR